MGYLILIILGVPILLMIGWLWLMMKLVLSPYYIWEYFYFKSEKFLEIKNKLARHIKECNDMNDHIESLKMAYVGFDKTNYGTAENKNTSVWNFKKKALKEYESSNYAIDCSLTVLRNAKNQPLKYLLKYFNIPTNEDSLSVFENTLNDFSAVKQGVEILLDKRQKVLKAIEDQVPFIFRFARKEKFAKELGFEPVEFKETYVPTYSFRYISPGGNASQTTDIKLSIDNLNAIVEYLGGIIKFRKTAAGQRALMTSKLREKIKDRDNYTCKKCGNNTKREPNLLLEIDHIVPVSKGGLTSEDNLQTLCWKCNRAKGAKLS